MAIDPDAAYWSVAISPLPRTEGRFNLASLQPALERAVVSLRGWNFPHIPRHREDISMEESYLEGRTDWARYQEIFRFHTDGLFTFRWRMREDGTSFAGTIHAVAAIYTIAEIWEFARRLYGRESDAQRVAVDVRLDNVRGRRLSGDTTQDLPIGAEARANAFHNRTVISRIDLLADAAPPAQATSRDLFMSLGIDGIGDRFIEETTQSFLRRGGT